jgi:putative FmdB family regulatory protein
MPVYEYRCGKCGHEFEELQRITADPIRKCPKCGKNAVERLISKTSFILKGTGWYKTDYASPSSSSGSSSPPAKGESSDDSSSAAGKTESKPATSPETKPASSSESKPSSSETKPAASGETKSAAAHA